VSADDLRKWIAEGRANAQTLAWTSGMTEWRPLGSFTGFAGLFPAPVYAAPVQYAPVSSTNGMAIAGFLFSLLGIPCCWCCLFPFLGLIFSIIGVAQTSGNSSQGGRGLAIAGLIISLLTLLALIILWIVGAITGTVNVNNQHYQL
jgi:hypothetical protein